MNIHEAALAATYYEKTLSSRVRHALQLLLLNEQTSHISIITGLSNEHIRQLKFKYKDMLKQTTELLEGCNNGE
ncbi:hypothetical protein ACWU4D_04410 [Vibrio sp. WJH972]